MSSNFVSGTLSTLKSNVSVTLTINVADVNDLNPVFPQPLYEFNFTENTSGFLVNIVAADADGTIQNNNLTYKIYDPTNSGILSVAPDGNITVNAEKLDREAATSHQFLLIATDTAADATEQRMASTFLVVNVLDENDNAPVISPTNYSINIAHYAPFQSSIFDFDATDPDIIGTVSFKAVNPSDPDWAYFELNSTNGDVTVKSRADVGIYTVEVFANDENKNSSFATLNINVREESLAFVSDRYHYTVREDGDIDFFFDIAFLNGKVGIKAISTINSTTIKYYIRNETQHEAQNKFKINEMDGKLRIKEKLDFETQRYYAFNVDAVDTTGELRNATTLVVIDIIDVVDVNPKAYVICFDDKQKCTHGSFNLTENPAIGQVVAVIYVEDPDTATTTDGGLEYKLNDPSLPFKIMKGHLQTTGYIVVDNASAIDFEIKNQYNITVLVEDGQNLAANPVEVTVNIIDANDNSPIFGKPNGYVFSIPESDSSSSVADTVEATDADGTSPYNTVTYSVRGNESSVIIDPSTGVITINSTTDYETKKYYLFSVVATDSALPDSYKRENAVPVTITLQDVNDNKPVFKNYPYSIEVSEKVPVGRQVFTFSASDADSGLNAQIEYKALAMDTSLFALDTTTGIVSVVAPLNYEVATSHNVTIYAEDKGKILSKYIRLDSVTCVLLFYYIEF